MRINPPLVALAIGAFGIGVTEFAPMGMLPSIATDLGVSIPAAGLLVSAYAIGVLIGAPLMTLATVKIPRRYLLIGLMAIFTLGNLMSALASDYASLLVAAWSPRSTTVLSSASARSSRPAWCRPRSALGPWQPCSWA